MTQKQSWQFATLALCVITAHADEVLLKNGDKISGTVINKSGDALELKTDYADKVVIKWDAVQTLKSSKPLTVILKDKQELTGLAETAADGTMTLKSDGVYNTQPIPLNNVNEINKKFFSGAANFGGGLSDGNTTRQAYHGDANVLLRGRDDKVTFGGQYNYADNQDSVTKENSLNARNWQVFGTYGHFFTDKWYGYAHALLTNDRLADIQLRTSFGVGAGYEFFNSKDLNLSFEVGPDYVNTNFYNTSYNCVVKRANDPNACDTLKDTSGVAARWFVNYDQFILNRSVQIFHNHEGIFDGDVFIRSRTGFHVPIWNGIQFTNEVQVDYYSGYPVVAKKQAVDTRYLFSIGYGW
ncbi:MAG: DUF481 domain-containing protein [Methylococcaceae bacterium]|nr:DUF481 domain-containing protein [Methylococcaceae bacterium]